MAKDEFESQDARDDAGIFIHSELDDYGLNPLEFRVYGRLARRAGKKGKSRQSVPHMAQEFGVHKRSVQRALRLLVICGLADGQVRLGKPTVYTLNPRRKWKDRKHLASIREHCRNSKGATPGAWVQDFDGSDPASPGVRHQEPGGATPQPHEGIPIKVLPEGTPDIPPVFPEQSYGDPFVVPPDPDIPPYFSPPFVRALQNFEAAQKELKKPIGPVRRRALYEKLAVWSEDQATQALIDATTNGWNGVFVPKEQNGNGSNGHKKNSDDRPIWMASKK